MGGHGHGEPYHVPDYKTFKIEGIKELEELEAALAKKCLKDPWIRYCLCRCNPHFGGQPSYLKMT